MFADSNEGLELSKTLSMQMVEQVAPEELEIFDELYQETLMQPTLSSPAHKDDVLGFGVTGIMVAATPVVAVVVKAVISFLVTEVVQTAKNESSALIQEKVKALFNPKKEEKVVPLTQAQLENIRKLAIKRACEMGMKEEKARQLALALVGSLVL